MDCKVEFVLNWSLPHGSQAMQGQMGHGRNNYISTNRQLVLVSGSLAFVQPLVNGIFLYPSASHPSFMGPGFQLFSCHHVMVLTHAGE